jgi:hypothetical protein
MRKEYSFKGAKICLEIIARQKHEKCRVNSPHTLQVYGVTYFYTEVQVRQRLLDMLGG